MYFNSRKEQDSTAHLKVAYHLNAGDANAIATYKLYFGGGEITRPNSYFHERRPAEDELRTWSDLRARRGQPSCRVVPFEKTICFCVLCFVFCVLCLCFVFTKPPGGPVAVKATNKTARRNELSTPASLAKRKLPGTWAFTRIECRWLAKARWPLDLNVVAMCPMLIVKE